MPRNAEVIRQWNVLRQIEASRRETIDGLARKMEVTTRTIRRDLEALQLAGFPLYDELIDGKRFWKLDTRPFKGLGDTGFTLSELCALYFSRTLLECVAGTPFQQDLTNAFTKFERILTPRMRQFLEVDTSHPLGFGMPAVATAFFARSPAFAIGRAPSRSERWTGVTPEPPETITAVASYPSDDLLKSGWLLGEGVITERAAVVDAAVEDGRIVLLGFRTQHRGQPHGTFKLLFNSLYVGASEEATMGSDPLF